MNSNDPKDPNGMYSHISAGSFFLERLSDLMSLVFPEPADQALLTACMSNTKKL